MPKVTLHEEGAAPQPEKPAAPAAPGEVTDARGRRLRLREMTLLQEQDLIVAMGAHAESEQALRRAFLAARVADIDGNAVEVPMTNRIYRAMMDRVGKEGLAAVVESILAEQQETDETALAKN
jgi:hypothetical protein